MDFSQGIYITHSGNIRIFGILILIFSGLSLYLNFALFYELFVHIQDLDTCAHKKYDDYSPKYKKIYKYNEKYVREVSTHKITEWNADPQIDTTSLDLAAEAINDEEIKRLRTHITQRLFSYWYIFHVAGNFIQFSSAVLLISNYTSLFMESVLLGIGTFMGWITSLRFLAKIPQYYVLFKTIELSIPTVTKVLFGTFPVYIAYALTGACLFWRSERFKDTQASLISLLPMFWGNNIYDNYNSIGGSLAVFSQLYIYGFAIFFSW